MQLRKATPEDKDLLLFWDSQPHLQTTSFVDEDYWENELVSDPDWREHLIAEENGTPIGFLQIIDPAQEVSHYWGEVPEHFRAIDIWIGEEKNINKGFGSKMMQLAIDRCFSEPLVTTILLDPLESNVKAHRFYERLGFEYIEQRWFDDDYCRVYALTREKWSNQNQ